MEGPDGSFNEPALRCDSCQAIMRRSTLHKFGACTKCGNKRMRNIEFFDEKERDQMQEWGFVDFLNEFEEVPDE